MSNKHEEKIVIYENKMNGMKVKDYIRIKNNLTRQILDSLDNFDLHELIDFIERMISINPELKLNLLEVKKLLSEKKERNSFIPADIKVKEFDYDEQNALLFIDTLKHEISITSNFFNIFDIERREYSLKGLIKSVLRNMEDSRKILKTLRNDTVINKEYMETVYLKNGKKLEIIYKIYELPEYQGILFNIKRIDNIAPLINYDNLTGTLNREIILDKLEDLTAFNKANDIAVLLINLNDFRNINNLFGYKLGDYVIKSISSRIEDTIRKYDILGRINGDEFILILTNYKAIRNVEIICKRILEIIQDPVMLANKKYKVTASIGISIYDQQNKSASKLMSSANLALIKAREKGKNNFEFYDDSLHNIYLHEINMENELKNAIATDEFEIHYQPQFDVENKKIISLEALVRWKHPKKGIISPDKFIPIAEKNGDIIPLGKLILRKSLIESKEILELYNLKLAINFSGTQFDDPSLVDIMSSVIMETDQAAKYIELEITETTAMNNLEINIEKMKELRHLNFGLAIDDFGAGYSSLTYLRKFPITKLKIDRGFIINIVHDKELQSIVKSIIDIGKTLKVSVVMEGIETNEELRVLRKIGCNIFQGYFFERPIKIEQLKRNFEEDKYNFNYLED